MSDLVLKRDIYYTLNPGRSDYGHIWDAALPRTAGRAVRHARRPGPVAAWAICRGKDYPIGPEIAS